MANTILLEFGSKITSCSRTPISQVSLEAEPSSNQSYRISTVNCGCCGFSLMQTEQGWLLTAVVVTVVWHNRVGLGSQGRVELPRFTPLQGGLRCLLQALLSGRPFILLVLWYIFWVQLKPLTTWAKQLLQSFTTFIKTHWQLKTKCFSQSNTTKATSACSTVYRTLLIILLFY